jgi:hypothetical protein
MAKLTITGITVSVDLADKTYGSGKGSFMSASARVPEGETGIPLEDGDQVISDGLDLYLAAWQTMLQGRLAAGEITSADYRKQTATFLSRLDKVKALYQRVKNMTPDQLESCLEKEQ